MSVLTADDLAILVEAIEDAGGRPTPYSGRSMYGKECLGVELDASQVGGFQYRLAASIVASADDPAEILSELAADARVDQFGNGEIHYWPDIPVPEGVS
jgi:hypothetical protein